MPKKWYIKTKDGSKGPYRSKVLVQLASEGKLLPNCAVSHDCKTWVKARHLSKLQFPSDSSKKTNSVDDVDPELSSWYILTKNIVGPISFRRLRRLAESGRVSPNIGVSQDCKRWIKAKKVSGLEFPNEPHQSDTELPQVAESQKLVTAEAAPEIVSDFVENVAVEQDAFVEDVVAEDVVVEDVVVEDVIAEDVVAEDVVTEDVVTEDISTEEEVVAAEATVSASSEDLQAANLGPAAQLLFAGLNEFDLGPRDANPCNSDLVDDNDSHSGYPPDFHPLLEYEYQHEASSDDKEELPAEPSGDDDSEELWNDDTASVLAEQSTIETVDETEVIEEAARSVENSDQPATDDEVDNEPVVPIKPIDDAVETQGDSRLVDAAVGIDSDMGDFGNQVMSPWAKTREQKYLQHFGRCSHTARTDELGGLSIDVYIFPPNQVRPFTTLVTSGMSDFRMNLSKPFSPRAELVMYVDEAKAEHVNLLCFLAQIPYRNHFPMRYGSVINYGDPAVPIETGSQLDGFVLMAPNVDADYKIRDSLSIAGDPLHLLWPIPVSKAERDVLSRDGMQRFCGLLDRYNHPLLFSPQRPCYASMLDNPSFA